MDLIDNPEMGMNIWCYQIYLYYTNIDEFFLQVITYMVSKLSLISLTMKDGRLHHFSQE